MELTIKDWTEAQKSANEGIRQALIMLEINKSLLSLSEDKIKCLAETTLKESEKSESS